MYKKYLNKLAALIMAILVMASALPVYAASSDLKGNWAEKEIQRWIGRGVLNGGAGGKFKPDATISRAEFVAILNRVFKYSECAAIHFSDVKSTDWYAVDIGKAVAAGILQGNGGKVRPNSPVSRQEAAVILARVFELDAKNAKAVDKYKDGKSVPSWSRDALNAMAGRGYLPSRLGSVLKPAANISRAEAVKMLDNIVTVYISKPGTYTTISKGNAVINSKGVILKSVNVTGNLYLTQGIGNGTVTLNKVTVSGMAVVNGGGAKGVVLQDSTVKGKLLVDKEANINRIVRKGKSSILAIAIKGMGDVTGHTGLYSAGGSTSSSGAAGNTGSGGSSGATSGSAISGGGSSTTSGSAISGGGTSGGAVPSTPGGTGGGTPSSDASTLKLLGAYAILGGQRIDAVQQSNGEWLVDLKGKSGNLTDITVNASTDVAKATFDLSGWNERTIDFSNGQANMNVHEMMGPLDGGEPGVSVPSIKASNVTQVTVTLRSSSGTTANVTIRLSV